LHTEKPDTSSELDLASFFLLGNFVELILLAVLVLQVDLIQLTLQAKIAWSSFDSKPH